MTAANFIIFIIRAWIFVTGKKVKILTTVGCAQDTEELFDLTQLNNSLAGSK